MAGRERELGAPSPPDLDDGGAGGGGRQGRLRSLPLASLGDSPAVRRDAPTKSGAEGLWFARCKREPSGERPARSVPSFTPITASDNDRASHPKGPFVHVIHGPAAPAHKATKRIFATAVLAAFE